MAKVPKELQYRDNDVVDSDLQYNIFLNRKRPIKKPVSNRGLLKKNIPKKKR